MWVRAAHRLGVSGGLFAVLVSAGGLALVAVTQKAWKNSMAHRAEVTLALLLALVILSYGWAAMVATIGQKRGWSAVRCYRVAALPFMVVGGSWAFVAMMLEAQFGLGLLVFSAATITGQMARKIAHPESKLWDPTREPAVESLRL